MSKLISMGECLIDFIPNEKGVSLDEVSSFSRKAGGAPANVAACVAKLGGESYFLGKFGADKFGEFLLATLKKSGINTQYTSITEKAKTALAFVSLKSDGDRDFSFYRNPSADMLLDKEDIKNEWFSSGDILHYCSVDLIEAPVKYAHKKAIDYAKANNALISFDINIRLSLWESQQMCVDAVKEFLEYADIVKVSEDELSMITDLTDEKQAITKLFSYAKNAKLVFVTKGGDGVTAYDNRLKEISVPAYKVTAVDATGAGDCFIGCVLYQILKNNDLSLDNMEKAMQLACAGAAVVVGRYGAIEAMPTLTEIKNIINK